MKYQLMIILLSVLTSYGVQSKGDHSHDFDEKTMAFHNAMAPLWHMDIGRDRKDRTCSAVSGMIDLATKIAHSKPLVDSLQNLVKDCEKSDEVFQESFKKVHLAFHKISDKPVK